MLMQDIVIGNKYFWNVGNFMIPNHPHIETKEVIVLSKDYEYEVVKVRSLQTGGIFFAGINTIQDDPQKYKVLFQNAVKANNPNPHIVTNIHKEYKGEQNYVLRILKYPDNTLIEYINKDGEVKYLNVSWFANLQMDYYEHVNCHYSKSYEMNRRLKSSIIQESIKIALHKLAKR